MSDQISGSEFSSAPGVEEWRTVWGGGWGAGALSNRFIS